MDFWAIVQRFERGADTQKDMHDLIMYIHQLRAVIDELEEEHLKMGEVFNKHKEEK